MSVQRVLCVVADSRRACGCLHAAGALCRRLPLGMRLGTWLVSACPRRALASRLVSACPRRTRIAPAQMLLLLLAVLCFLPLPSQSFLALPRPQLVMV